MCNMSTTGNLFRNVREVPVKNPNTPPPTPPPWWSYDSMRNVYMFRKIREVLVKNVYTPPLQPHPLMILRQHVQRVHVP